jgi:hypothetical protein
MVAVVVIPAVFLLLTRLARGGGAPKTAASASPVDAAQISNSRPSGPTLTTGVVPIAASPPQH